MRASSIPKGILRAIGSVFVPRTPRGRVRQATFLILLILGLTANFADSRWWDRGADWINEKVGVAVPHYWATPFRLGLDLQGGTHLVYTADVKDIKEADRDDALAGVRDVIERRVNAFGVAEPVVQTNKAGEDWRVTVDLAGIKDISEAIKLIGETPILEFKEQGDGAPVRDLTAEEQQSMAEANAAAKKRAEEALRKARAGEDFAALAAEYSDDEATKTTGGNLDWSLATGPQSEIIGKIVADRLQIGGTYWSVIEAGGYYNVVKYEERRESDKEVKAAHILICWQGADRCEQTRTKEEAKALADNLKSRVNAANFAALAKTNSDDAGSAVSGGDLGWFAKGAMVEPFATTTFDMAKGAVSEVVETNFGYHIIYKNDERPVYEYRLSAIRVDMKEPADYLPEPSPWKNTELSGKHLKSAMLQFDPNTGAPDVGIEFNDEGKKLFADITGRNVGAPVAIFLDGQAISVPTVQEAILEGSAVITGKFTVQEAKLLARRLNAGALPVPIRLESQQSVGASLGRDSLDRSLFAGLLGFLAVALFMLLYYRLPGLLAIIALGLYTAINLSLYKLIPVTMTLSGIAGFILSVGMAVDANVLIFERMKEELRRGRSLQSAIDEGFNRAWLSIRDSNFTTLLSCTILFFTSSSLIKGFAVTLGLGVIISMFSAITVSRTLLRLVAGWGFLRRAWLYLPGFSRATPEAKSAVEQA